MRLQLPLAVPTAPALGRWRAALAPGPAEEAAESGKAEQQNGKGGDARETATAADQASAAAAEEAPWWALTPPLGHNMVRIILHFFLLELPQYAKSKLFSVARHAPPHAPLLYFGVVCLFCVCVFVCLFRWWRSPGEMASTRCFTTCGR